MAHKKKKLIRPRIPIRTGPWEQVHKDKRRLSRQALKIRAKREARSAE